MGTYQYTPISETIPSIPILPVKLNSPNPKEFISVYCQAILDTGSDVTLVSIPLLVQARARIVDSSIRIPVGGIVTIGVPYMVGLTFDRCTYSAIRVYGCPISDLGEFLLIGRDIMNRHCIEFDGEGSRFTIF